MGWGSGGTDSKGRPIGYYHSATCDHPDCNEKIDRGLAYVCGMMHGNDEYSCEGYFCGNHQRVIEIDKHICNEVTNVFSVCTECECELHEIFDYDPEEDIFIEKKE